MDKTESHLSNIIDNEKHPLESENYRLKCKETLDKEGVLFLKELQTLQALFLKLKEMFGLVLGKTQNLQYFI